VVGTAGQGAVPTDDDDDGCEHQRKDADGWTGTDACGRVGVGIRVAAVQPSQVGDTVAAPRVPPSSPQGVLLACLRLFPVLFACFLLGVGCHLRPTRGDYGARVILWLVTFQICWGRRLWLGSER